MTSRVLSGTSAAPGLALGPGWRWQADALVVPRRQDRVPEVERARLQDACAAARGQITSLREQVAVAVGAEEAAIFEAHLMFLDDPALQAFAEAQITQGWNAEAAWADGVEHFALQLDGLPDPTLRARAADVRDVGRRVLAHLLGRGPRELRLERPSVVIARDLMPSEVAALDRGRVLAVCLAEGGPTSHAAILARAWGIPAVVGLGPGLLEVDVGPLWLVDGERGVVVVDPVPAEVEAFQGRAQRAAQENLADRSAAQAPAVTLDGYRLEVAANVGSIGEATVAVASGADAIGLLRSEFLYLNRLTAPDEEEQFAAYRGVLQAMGGRPVVARTLDVGGDKPLAYLPVGSEANPFLGHRGIRLLLDSVDLLKVQLRALLRAGAGFDLRIMFPMVATLEELRRAKEVYAEVRSGLAGSMLQVAERVQVGMMVEVPAAALLAHRFAAEVDFFSVGTNDLTQYTMAADRGNEKVAHLNDGCHPAVLRQIQLVVQAGRSAGIWVGVCGELAADPDAIPVLLGLEVDELSMAPPAIPRAKAILRRWRLSEARSLAAEALDLDSAPAVRALVRSRSRSISQG